MAGSFKLKIIIIFVLILILISFSIIYLTKDKKTEKNTVEFEISLKKTDIINIDEKIDKITNIEKNKIKKINNSKLKITNKNTLYKDTYFINIKIYTKINNKETTKITSIYYDIKNNKFINIDNILTNNYQDFIKNKSKQILKDKYNSKLDINNFYLDEEGLNIIYNINNQEYKVKINKQEINNYLKENYKYKIKEETNTEKPTINNSKLLAITFDDGPSNYTDYLLDELNKTNTKVTFFVLGSRVPYYKNTILKMKQNNHQIASHFYSHKDLTKMNTNEILNEKNNTNNLIKNITEEDTLYFRPPYGAYNINVLNTINMYPILWSVDTLDWKYRDENYIYNYIINNAKDGDIILLHDLYKTSIDASLKAINTLKKQGYNFVTVKELHTLRNINLNTKTPYYKFT